MAFTTFTPKAANTVQAQTITAVVDNSKIDLRPHYKLADGTLIATDACIVQHPGYVPVPGDYLVVTQKGSKPTVWKASTFLANYS